MRVILAIYHNNILSLSDCWKILRAGPSKFKCANDFSTVYSTIYVYPLNGECLSYCRINVTVLLEYFNLFHNEPCVALCNPV